MLRDRMSRLRAGIVAALAIVLVPASRGPLILGCAAVILWLEVRSARDRKGRPVDLLVDGEHLRVPARGADVPFAGSLVHVARVDDGVQVDDELLRAGDVRFRGSSLLEVVR